MPLTAADFARILREHGMTVDKAMAALAGEKRPPDRHTVERWLAGDMVPSLNPRFALERAAEVPIELSNELTSAVSGRVEGDDLARVERLCTAVRKRDPRRVQAALADAVIIDAWDAEGRTAIDHAAEAQNVDVARILLGAGASPIAMSKGIRTAFQKACELGHAPMIQLMLEFGARPKTMSQPGGSSFELLAASEADDPRSLEALWQAGNFSGVQLTEPLCLAAGRGNLRLMRKMLELDARIDDADPEGRRALHHAAAAGQGEAVALLLENGAAVRTTDRSGDTPLHAAARGGHESIAELLMKAGADIEAENAAGERPTRWLNPSTKPRGPSWFDPDAPPLFFYYSKAFLAGFDPKNVDAPFLSGGDYMGAYPTTARDMLKPFVREDMEKYGFQWLYPFVARVLRHQDFTVAELEAAARAKGYEPFTRSEYR